MHHSSIAIDTPHSGPNDVIYIYIYISDDIVLKGEILVTIRLDQDEINLSDDFESTIGVADLLFRAYH